MTFVWATRGRTWGFRILRTGGVPDPLAVYERAFVGVGGDAEAFHAEPTTIAVRFPDPEGRTDRAGRVIPHEFVVLDAGPTRPRTLLEARDVLWAAVADVYTASWEAPAAPPSSE